MQAPAKHTHSLAASLRSSRPIHLPSCQRASSFRRSRDQSDPRQPQASAAAANQLTWFRSAQGAAGWVVERPEQPGCARVARRPSSLAWPSEGATRAGRALARSGAVGQAAPHWPTSQLNSLHFPKINSAPPQMGRPELKPAARFQAN